MPKRRFKKVASSPLQVFTIAQSKIEILLLNFICVLFLCSFLTYILIFLITAKYGFLQEFIFGKMGNCDFWGSKRKYQKFEIFLFVERSILHFWWFWITFYFEIVYSRSLQTLTFWPKMEIMLSFKRLLWKTYFSEILVEDVKLMSKKVLKIFITQRMALDALMGLVHE